MPYKGTAYEQKPDDTDDFRHASPRDRAHAGEKPCRIDVYFTLWVLSVIANQHDRHTERLKNHAKLKMKSNLSFFFPLSFSAAL